MIRVCCACLVLWALVLGITSPLSAAFITAGPITVGPGAGNPDTQALSDWGLTVDGINAKVWTPGLTNNTSGVHPTLGSNFYYHLEDFTSTSNTAYIGPRYGGQDYDAEFLGVGSQANFLLIALATGQRTNNGPTLYAPGDLYITTDQGIFGIEMTGQTYKLDSHGYTIPTQTTDSYAAGTIIKTGTAGQGWVGAQPTLAGGDLVYPDAQFVQLKSGSSYNSVVGTLNSDAFYFSESSTLGQHALYEMAINLGIFQGATIQSVHWSPSCGNDILYVETDISSTPEPSSLVLFGLGASIMGVMGARRRQQAAAAEAQAPGEG